MPVSRAFGRIIRRLSKWLSPALILGCLLVPFHAFAAGEVEVRTKLTPGVWLNSKSLDRLEQDLTQMVERLRKPDDPKIKVVLGTAYNRGNVLFTTEGDTATLHVQPGIFALTHSLSDLAGYFAYQLSKLKKQYQNDFKLYVDVAQIPPGMKKADYVRSLPPLPADSPPEEVKKQEHALALAERIDRYEARRTDKDLKAVMNTAGFQIDLKGASEDNIKAALEAIDRLVAGGYDPWGMFNPIQSLNAIENSKGFLKKFREKETINVEAEFVRNYLLYLEAKKVDITQQPLRGKPLTSEQARVQQRATLTQSTGMGPLTQSILGWGGTTALGAYLLSSFWDDLGTAKKDSLQAIDNRRDPVPVDGPIANEGFQPPKGKSFTIPSEYVDPIVDLAADLYAPGYYYLMYRFISKPFKVLHREYGTLFNERYFENLRQQARLRKQTRTLAKQETASPADLAKLVEQQHALLDFVLDGMEPDSIKARARDLYRIAFTSRLGESGNEKSLRIAAEKHFQTLAQLQSEDPIPKKALEAQAKRLAKMELLLEGQISPELEAKLPVKSQSRAAAASSLKYLNFLYRYFGGLSYLFASKNTEDLIQLMRKRLDAGGLAPDERDSLREALLRLRGVELLSPEVKDLYTETLRRYFPEVAPLEASDPQALKALLAAGKISQRDYLIALSSFERDRSQTAAEKVRIFSQLSEQGLHIDAARYLNRHFKPLMETAYDSANPEITVQDRQEFVEGLRRLFGSWDRLQTRAWTSAWLRKSLYLKTLAVSDPKARSSIGGILSTELLKPGSSHQKLFDALIFNFLNETRDPGELIRSLEELRTDYQTESRAVSDYILKRLTQEPGLIANDEALDRLLADETLWRKLSLGSGQIPNNWEGKILKKYQENAQKYDAYSFDPSFSETLQPLLIRTFGSLHPEASPEERLAFWKKLAARGPTGVSDEYFQAAFEALPQSAGKAALAQFALDQGLIWDNRIRARLYQLTSGYRIDAKTLQEQASTLKSTLRDRLVQLSRTTKNEDRKSAAAGTLEYYRGTFASRLKKDPGVAPELQQLVGRLSRDGLAPEKAALAIDAFLKKNDETLNTTGRRAALEAEIGKIHNAFPETGRTFVELVDWLSAKTQTTESEAEYLKDKIIEAESSHKDLGYAVVNEIIEEALLWDKPEKWKLIRWLRGTGPVPERLRSKMKRIGPETVRRAFSTLPIFARQGFLGTLLGSKKSGLLSGMSRAIYHEQILDEILPREKEGAKIANDLLAAFLKSTAMVSHPEKKVSVIAYLLANHAEDSSVGLVLRRTLEAYGVVGVKFAQILSSSDVLPEDIRKELAKTRDEANPPMRHQVFERLREILKKPKISSDFTVEDLRGAASIKYAIKVRDPKGGEHVIQVKREEADVGIAKDFEQLEIIVEDLIQKDASKYAFLRGMVEATKAAIWRELSLKRESERTDIATREYSRIRLPDGFSLEIPANSGLIEEIKGPRSRFFHLRSAEFAPGLTLNRFDPEVQKSLAKAVLEAEHQLLFPEDANRSTHFDPDRHPGNILFDVAPERADTGFQPIDWGQLLALQPEDRSRIIRLMSFAQIFEAVGLSDAIFARLCREFKIGSDQAPALRRKLSAFFPNTDGKPRGGLTPYYFLLSELEVAGLPRKIVNYDFIKAIYQLEPYEELLAKETHVSPKRVLMEKVREDARALAQGISLGTEEKIKLALLKPRAALTAARNAALLESGKKSLDDTMSSLGISPKGREILLRAPLDEVRTGSDLQAYLSAGLRAGEKQLSPADLAKARQWQELAAAIDVHPELLGAEDYAALISSGTVRHQMEKSVAPKERKPIAQPVHQGLVGSVANVYGAELVNAMFWSLWDQDPKMAQNWLKEMFRLEKHAGFGAFAASAGLVKYLGNATIPMSQKGLRYLNQGGFSMMIGITAQEAVRRLMEGQSAEEILMHLKSEDNLKELAFATSTFMAAEAVVKPLAKRYLPCSLRFRGLAETSAVFIAAGALDRATRDPLTDRGLLSRGKLAQMREIANRHLPSISEKARRIRELIRQGQKLEAIQLLQGRSWEAVLLDAVSCWPYRADFDTEERLERDKQRCMNQVLSNYRHYEPDPSGLEPEIAQYGKELRQVSADSTDSFEVAVINREEAGARGIYTSLEDEVRKTSGKLSPEVEAQLRKEVETLKKKAKEEEERFLKTRGDHLGMRIWEGGGGGPD